MCWFGVMPMGAWELLLAEVEEGWFLAELWRSEPNARNVASFAPPSITLGGGATNGGDLQSSWIPPCSHGGRQVGEESSVDPRAGASREVGDGFVA
jgi:hypothetical protein